MNAGVARDCLGRGAGCDRGMSNEAEDRLATLEVRYAFLERHVAEQDRVMLAMAERLDRLELRVRQMREQMEGADPGALPPDEKPPHY